ncbi:two-component system, NtrC family, sensor kinase [Candidatus Magnetomoraceae bacterium gMMP-13]
MKIGQKLILGFIGIALLVGLVGGIAIISNISIKNDISQLTESSINEVETAAEMRLAIQICQTAIQEIIEENYRAIIKPEKKIEAEAAAEDAEKVIFKSLKNFEKWLTLSKKFTEIGVQIALEVGETEEAEEEIEELENLKELAIELAAYKKLVFQYINLIKTKISVTDIFLEETLEPHFNEKLLPFIEIIKNDSKEELKSKAKEIKEALFISNTLIIIGTIIALIIALIIGIYISYSISRPITKLKDTAIEIGRGKLDIKINIKLKDEIGDLANSFNKMTEDLKKSTVSRNYFDNIIKSMIEALIVITPEGNIQSVNEATLNLLEYNENEIIGQAIGILFTEKEEEKNFKDTKLQELIKKDSVQNLHLFYYTKYNEKIPVSISGSVMRNKEGELIGIVCVARDMREINKLKKLEQKRSIELEKTKDCLEDLNKTLENRVTERTADLQRANEKLILTNRKLKDTQYQLIQSSKLASIGELATGVAHELNQPLSYIRNNAQLIMMDSPEDYDFQEVYETFQKIEEGTDRMMLIINNLRRSARQTIIEFIPFDIHKVIDNTLIFYNEQFKVHNIQIEKKFASWLPKVIGNSNQIEQVFINLISNARDALDEKEEARLIIKTEFQAQKNNPGMISIKFIDNGMGISLFHQEKIFDPFFTTKEEGEGTGLGLSISYGIIKEHKGNINVISVEGKGTTFTITLPALKNEE